MIIYIIVLLIAVLANFLVKDKKKQKYVMYFIFFLLTFLACFRKYTVGADTPQFWDNFLKMLDPQKVELMRYEKGFILLCQFIQIFTKNPQFLIIISSLFINVSVFLFIKKHSKNILFSTLLYITLNFYFSFICLMRQGIAIAILLFAMDFLFEKKYIKFSLLVILASQFHFSSIFCLGFLIIPLLKTNKKIISLTIIASVFCFIISRPLFLFVASNFADYSKYIGSSYAEPSYISAGLYTLTNFLFLLFGFIAPPKEKVKNIVQKDQKYIILSYILAFGTVISAISMGVSIFNRFFIYFNFFCIIWVANCLELIDDLKTKRIWMIILTICTIAYVCVITAMGWYGVLPYQFCWE